MDKIKIQKPPESPSIALSLEKLNDFYLHHKDDFDQNGVYRRRFQLPHGEPFEDVNISVFNTYRDKDHPLIGLSLRTNFDIGSTNHRPFTRIRIIEIEQSVLVAQRMTTHKGRKRWSNLDDHETSSVVSLLNATIFNRNKQN